jgi:hypothetical protein
MKNEAYELEGYHDPTWPLELYSDTKQHRVIFSYLSHECFLHPTQFVLFEFLSLTLVCPLPPNINYFKEIRKDSWND